MRTPEQENQVTLEVIECQSWMELKHTIKRHAPFTSNSRSTPVEWSEERLLRNMEIIRHEYKSTQSCYLNHMTRANGLRAKVAELVLANNYGDPWQ